MAKQKRPAVRTDAHLDEAFSAFGGENVSQHVILVSETPVKWDEVEWAEDWKTKKPMKSRVTARWKTYRLRVERHRVKRGEFDIIGEVEFRGFINNACILKDKHWSRALQRVEVEALNRYLQEQKG